MKGNAQIESTMLGYEDHGILTAMIFLKQKGCGQGFGGWRLDAPDKINNGNSDATCKWIKHILRVVGVDCWEKLSGKYVRVDGEEFGEIHGIGNITEEQWFYPKKDMKA